MTGFRNALLGAAGAAGGGGYSVGNSILLDDGSSQNLKRTPSLPASERIGTFSMWVKRGVLGTSQRLFSNERDDGAATQGLLEFQTDDQLHWKTESTVGANIMVRETTQVFRDPHAWYHIMVTWNSNNTDDTCASVWVNGEQVTDFVTKTNFSSPQDIGWPSTTKPMVIGSLYNNSTYFDGYLSEFVYLDGTASSNATDFGEYDTNGVWRPVDVSGLTFGNNGFYLPFSAGSGANLGANSVPASTFTPAAGSYVYNATYLTIGSGTIDNNGSPGVSGRLNNPFNGDFTFSFTATAIAGSIFGVFDATELSTFSTGTDDGGLDSMTNSWWYDDGGNGTGGGGTVGNGYFMYGNSSQGTGPIAAGSAVTIERTGSTIKITDDSSDAHSFSQTFSGPVYIMVGHRNIASKSMNYDSVSMNGKQAFAVNGSPTQSSDTPTNVIATLSPLWTDATLSNGNLTTTNSGAAAYQWSISTMRIDDGTGKYVMEATRTAGTFGRVGILTMGAGSKTASSADQYTLNVGNGEIVKDSSLVTTITTPGASVIRVEYDSSTDTIEFFDDGSSVHSATAGLTDEGGGFVFCVNPYQSSAFDVVFDTGNMAGTPSTGFVTLSSANLYTNAAPAIEDGTAYFQATAYEGNGGTAQNIDQSGNSTFQPDFVWIKNRDAAFQHKLLDAIRGVGQELYSNQADAETTDTAGLTSFDSDGFGLGTDNGGYNSANSFVAWQWKGDGTSGSSNTDGSITSTVNVNDTAGFSIVKYTGTGSNATIGHGMSAAPELIHIKKTDSTESWISYSETLGGGKHLYLNLTAAETTASNVFNNTAPTSTVFSVGTAGSTNTLSSPYIAYCWRSIPGYSAFGSYVGNGSSDGPVIMLDFTPAYLLVKNINSGSVSDHWYIQSLGLYDYNGDTGHLFADAADVEQASRYFDYVSNGFKVVTTSATANGSNETHIYAAFAEHPFAGSSPATAR